LRERDEMSELRGVVYMIKRRGPRTEPCGTPQNRYGGRINYFCISHGEDQRQIRFEPVKDSASYSKPRGKTRQ